MQHVNREGIMALSSPSVTTDIPLSERLFGICVLLYSSTAFIRMFLSEEQYSNVMDESGSLLVRTVPWMLAYTFAFLFVYKNRKRVFTFFRRVPLLLVILGYAGASVSWSSLKLVSVMSFAALLGNSILGIYFGMRYRTTDLMRLLGWFCGIAAVGTVISPLVIRDYAIDGGFWTGFFAQKNAMGVVMALGSIVFASLSQLSIEWRWTYRVFLALCIMLVVFSGSATCFVILCSLLALAAFRMVSTRCVTSFRQQLALGALIFVSISWGLAANSDQVLAALGRSSDLSGRLIAWAFLTTMIPEHLFFGFGYGGFWVVGGPAQQLWDTLGIDPTFFPYAHNGYLQILIDCGLIGLALLLALLYIVTRRAWRYSTERRLFWPIYFVIFMLLLNLTESSFMVRNNLDWMLFIALTVQVFEERCGTSHFSHG